MENLNIIIGIVVGILSLLTAIFPNLSKKLKLKIITSLILSGSAIVYFNTDHYKHWKHYEENKISVSCRQLPPIIVDDDNFHYKFIAVIKNIYPESIKITNSKFDFQSRLIINGYNILLSDIPVNLIKNEINHASVFSTKFERISGKQIIAMSIDCSLKRGKAELEVHGATVNFSYKLFGKLHNKSFFVNPMEVISLRMPKKEYISFDLLEVFDHRKLPDFFFTYHYYKATNDSGDRKLEVYISGKKERFLKIKSEQPSGVKILESGRQIHNDIDPIRVLVLENNDMQIYSWLGKFRREEAAKNFRLGLELVQNKDFKAGAAAFKKAAKIDPKDSQSWFNAGLALERAEDYEAAIDSFQKAIEAKGDYSKAHCELGNVFIKKGDNEKAIYHLKKAIEVDPKYALAYFKLGCLQKSQGNYEEALGNLNNAIKYESDAEKRNRYKECLDELKEYESLVE